MRTNSTIIPDASRGFDVFRGSKLLRRFSTLEEAKAYAAEKGGRYIRYWAVKEG